MEDDEDDDMDMEDSAGGAGAGAGAPGGRAGGAGGDGSAGRRGGRGKSDARRGADVPPSSTEIRAFANLFEDIAVNPPQDAVLRQHWDTWVKEDVGKHNTQQNRQVWWWRWWWRWRVFFLRLNSVAACCLQRDFGS